MQFKTDDTKCISDLVSIVHVASVDLLGEIILLGYD
jgi:hypothetical protein